MYPTKRALFREVRIVTGDAPGKYLLYILGKSSTDLVYLQSSSIFFYLTYRSRIDSIETFMRGSFKTRGISKSGLPRALRNGLRKLGGATRCYPNPRCHSSSPSVQCNRHEDPPRLRSPTSFVVDRWRAFQRGVRIWGATRTEHNRSGRKRTLLETERETRALQFSSGIFWFSPDDAFSRVF